MFAPRYFAPRYFTPRYWPPGADVVTEEAPIAYYGGGKKQFVSAEFVKKLWELQEARQAKRKSSRQAELPMEVPVAKGIALPTPSVAATKVRQRRPVPGHFQVDIEAMISRQRKSLRERADDHAAKLYADRMAKQLADEEELKVMLLAAMIADEEL